MSIPRNLGNFADNVNTNGKVEVTGINATGTPSASTALLGNGTWGTVTTAPAGSTGQVQYNNAGAFGAISSGTSGQVLTSAGSGSAPTWASPAGGGSLTFLSTVTASNSSTIDIENLFSSTYDTYILVCDSIKPTNSTGPYINMTMKISGFYRSSGYRYFNNETLTDSTSFQRANNNSAPAIIMGTSVANDATNAGTNFILRIYNPSNSTRVKLVEWKGVTSVYSNDSAFANTDGFGGNANTGALTGIRFAFSTDTIASGTFTLYGLKKS